jgi:hypothetical protein
MIRLQSSLAILLPLSSKLIHLTLHNRLLLKNNVALDCHRLATDEDDLRGGQTCVSRIVYKVSLVVQASKLFIGYYRRLLLVVVIDWMVPLEMKGRLGRSFVSR